MKKISVRDWTRVIRIRERLREIHKDMSVDSNDNKSKRLICERTLRALFVSASHLLKHLKYSNSFSPYHSPRK